MNSVVGEIYKSKAWKKISVGYAISKNCICEKCGRSVYVSKVNDYLEPSKRLRYVVHHKISLNPNNCGDDSIAYGWDNLQLLCIDCHNNIHNPNTSVRDGLMFDELGNLVKCEEGYIKRHQ